MVGGRNPPNPGVVVRNSTVSSWRRRTECLLPSVWKNETSFGVLLSRVMALEVSTKRLRSFSFARKAIGNPPLLWAAGEPDNFAQLWGTETTVASKSDAVDMNSGLIIRVKLSPK